MNRRTYLKAIGASIAGGSLIIGHHITQSKNNSATQRQTPTSKGRPKQYTDRYQGPPSTYPSDYREIKFQDVVNAVDNLGMDPTGKKPVDNKFSFQSGRLIEFPPGTYLFEESHVVRGIENWGIRGLGTDASQVRFVAPPERILRMFNIRSGRNVLLENITFDQREIREGSLGNVVRVTDGLQIHDIKHTGFEPSEETGTVSLLHPIVTDPNGVGVIDGYKAKMGFEEEPYPNNGLSFWAGPSHRGTLTIRNLYLENLPGLYMSRTEGDVRVENCTFRNNDSSAIRVCGDGSYIKDTTVEIDVDNSYNVVGEHDHNQGIRWESGFMGKSGGYIENVDIYCKSVNRSSGLLKIEGSAGAVTIRDSRIRCDPDGVPIVTSTQPGDTNAIDGLPDRPWSIVVDGLSVTGNSADDAPVLLLVGRDDSVVSNSCINISGQREGIVIKDSRSCLIENTNIRVPSKSIRLKNASVQTTGITHSKQCDGTAHTDRGRIKDSTPYEIVRQRIRNTLKLNLPDNWAVPSD